ncbi:MAG: N-acetylmuramoyl-L-alanine amidase [Bacteroidota bacterium]
MVKKIKYSIGLFLLASAFLGFALFNPAGTNKIRTIVIDPGHGGQDPGCHGVSSQEKTIALAVALKLGKLLEENYPDLKVIYTRTSDVFVDLEARAQIANKAKADLFISIHCNAAGKPLKIKDPKTGKQKTKMFKNKKGKLVPVETINPIPFGTETYVMGIKNEEGKMRVATRENSAIFYEDHYEQKYGGFDPESIESYIIMSNYTSAYVIQSANLAKKIQDEYTRKAGRIDKGVHRQSIWVLWRTSMPSILTEIGYLTNPLEETFMVAENGQDYLAKSIFRGLRKYKDEYEGNKKEYNDAIENQEPLENENIMAGNLPNQKPDDDDDENDSVQVNKEPEVKDTVYKNQNITDSTSSIKIANTFKNKIDLWFKVQFASSELPLDLKLNKYSALIEPDYYKANNIFKYTSGKFRTLAEAANHQTKMRAIGFNDCFVVAIKNGQRLDMNEAKKLMSQ